MPGPLFLIQPHASEPARIGMRARKCAGEDQGWRMGRCGFRSNALPGMRREQSIKPERVTDADNVAWRIVIEAERNMEIDLLIPA